MSQNGRGSRGAVLICRENKGEQLFNDISRKLYARRQAKHNNDRQTNPTKKWHKAVSARQSGAHDNAATIAIAHGTFCSNGLDKENSRMQR